MTRLAAAARRHWGLALVCALALLVGALAIGDYGDRIDTWAQHAIGKAALDSLAGDGERAFDQLYDVPSRYYGAAFEAPLVLILDHVLGLEDSRDVLLGRHLFTHLFFLVGGVFCYLLVLRLFGSRALALLALVLFLLHPRIYAHSFFNSKDIPFLAAFTITLYLVHRAFRRDTLGAFLLCGVGVGLLVNLRIMGIVLFAAVLVLRALDLAFAGSADGRRRALLTGGAFALTVVLTYYGSLPVLWTDPAGRFTEALGVANSHPEAGRALSLFRGELLPTADGLPFDYVPVWVGITTPPATLLLALAGAMALAWRGLRRPRAILRNGPLRFGILLAALPVVAVAAVVVLESNFYDHWRHLYFLYVPAALLAVLGFRGIAASVRGRWMRVGACALASAAVAVTVVAMVRIHPHQNHYFNALTDRTAPERPGSRYEMGFWHQGVWSTRAAIAGEHPNGRIFLGPSLDVAPLRLRDEWEHFTVTRDFRSGERNFFALAAPAACPLASAPPFAVVRVYATTLWCVVDPVAWFGDLRRGARAADPVARSVYDVWRHGRFLTWVRDGCPREDVEGDGPRFFLHVVPRDAGGIPPWRREHGFDNRDLAVRAGLARIDGNCVAVAVLPDYPIATVRTGQHDGTGRLWTAEFALPDGE